MRVKDSRRSSGSASFVVTVGEVVFSPGREECVPVQCEWLEAQIPVGESGARRKV